MTQVLLLGDSIRLNYQPLVKRALEGEFAVSGPEENGESSRFMLKNVQRWLDASRPDVVHLNCGLHDLRHDGGGGPQVPVGEYQDNLRHIFDLVRRGTTARLVWATITPVDEERHARNKESRRYADEVRRYNAAALELVDEFKLQVNDLYAAVTSRGASDFLGEDGVHVTPAGYTLLAEEVCRSIRSAAGSH